VYLSRLFLPILSLAIILLSGCTQSNTRYALLAIGNNEYKLEIADSNSERVRGLSFRQEVESGSGMLFIFDNSDYHSFWMKDTFVPLEILWLDEGFHVVDKKIMSVEKDPARPTSNYVPKSPARYAIEINPLSDNVNVEIGDKIDISFERR